MRTPDMSDEELDRLFQRGAEAFPDETSLSGWLRLETQLDEAARQHQVRRQLWQRVAGLFATEMGVVAVFLWLWLGHFPSNLVTTTLPAAAASQTFSTPSKEVAASKQLTLTQQPTADRAARVSPPLSEKLAAHTTPLELGEPDEHGAASQEVRSERLLRFSRPKMPFAGAASLAVSSSRTYRPAVAPLTEQVPLSKAPETTPTLAASSGLASTTTATTEQAAAPELVKVTMAPQLIAAADSGTTTPPARAAEPPLAPITPPDSLLPQRRRSPAPAYRFLVGLVGGPELSAVLPSPSPRTGGTVGIVAEYRFSSRLRVRTGILRSVKRYGARGSDYRPPAGYWTWRIPVEEVEANCRILEIPLDVRYDVRLRPGYSLYASAGLTSLVLRNERYTYHYELNGEYMERTRSYPNGGTQALQVLRLAVGYERNVAPRWVVQAEPFVNVPLHGVGFGQMRLGSTGLLLGLRYGLGHSKVVAPAP